MKAWLLFPVLLIAPAAGTQTSVDATQAQVMVNVLERCHTGKVSPGIIDEVMSLAGTRLIIAQQNISRRITSDQYKAVLVSACKGETTHLEPSDSGARAAKGVEGLVTDVAPSLLWGRDHVAYLKQRLAAAKENKGFGEIVRLALQNLPEKVALSPKLYFVMGGRAGAAAFDDGIYVDLLSDAWRSRKKNAPMTAQEMVEFFAHETHHVGYGEILDRRKNQLHLVGGEEQAWSFLTALMMEGSATLLINAHGSWAQLEKQDHIQADLARLPQLLPAAQNLLHRTLDAAMSDQEYQTAVSQFLGEGYHATGARLLSVIEQVRGKPGALVVMDDPRQLLTVYNDCAVKANQPFRFDPRIAEETETLGAKH
ncbi:MAG TPA: DUF5700 domain-containing putative Zn-dependent protease [Terriglobales bacterium]|nr:DUF5700 domain-containing putative Zn-dependent protease [Terriglobales bacterium]